MSEEVNSDAGSDVNTFLDRLRFRPHPEFSVTPENEFGLEVVSDLSHQLIDDLAQFIALCWQFSAFIQELPGEKHAVLAVMNPCEMAFPPDIAAEIECFEPRPSFNLDCLSNVYLLATESHRDLTRAIEMMPTEIRNCDGKVTINGIPGRSYLEALERFGFHLLKSVLNEVHATAAKDEVTGWDGQSPYWIPLSSFGPVCLAVTETWPELELSDSVHQLVANEIDDAAKQLFDAFQESNQSVGSSADSQPEPEATSDLQERVDFLRTILWYRHFNADGHPIADATPIGPTELCHRMKSRWPHMSGWSPPGISRMLKTIFGQRGFKGYKDLCQSPVGLGKLRKLLDSESRLERFAPLLGDVSFHDFRSDETRETEF